MLLSGLVYTISIPNIVKDDRYLSACHRATEWCGLCDCVLMCIAFSFMYILC